jgi:hypothetical protein
MTLRALNYNNRVPSVSTSPRPAAVRDIIIVIIIFIHIIIIIIMMGVYSSCCAYSAHRYSQPQTIWPPNKSRKKFTSTERTSSSFPYGSNKIWCFSQRATDIPTPAIGRKREREREIVHVRIVNSQGRSKGVARDAYAPGAIPRRAQKWKSCVQC